MSNFSRKNASNATDYATSHTVQTDTNSQPVLAQLTRKILLSDAIRDFLMDKKLERKSPRTTGQYSYYLARFDKLYPGRMVYEIEKADIRGSLAQNVDAPYASHANFRTLRAFFNWCEGERYLIQNPLAHTKAPELPKKVVQIYTDADIKSMIAAQSRESFIGMRNRALTLILYDTGIRLSELVGLTLDDVDLENGILKVKGKGDKERHVPFGKTAAKALWQYLRLRRDKYREIWLTEEKRPMQSRGVAEVFSRLGVALNLGKRCSPHTFRHTWAVNMLRNGCNIRDLQILGGWSSLDMVMRYTKALSTEDAIKAHKRFSPGDRL